MPYAANDRVSSDRKELTDVYITPEQYTQAVLGMTDGQLVSIVAGKMVVAYPPEPEPIPEQLDLFKE